MRQSRSPGPDGVCLTRPRCERRTGAFVSLGRITVAWCIACGWGFAVLSACQCVGSEKKQGALTWRCCHLRLHCYHKLFYSWGAVAREGAPGLDTSQVTGPMSTTLNCLVHRPDSHLAALALQPLLLEPLPAPLLPRATAHLATEVIAGRNIDRRRTSRADCTLATPQPTGPGRP